MIRKISVTNLLQPWKDNFTQNLGLPLMTESSLIGLDLLNDFIAKCKAECKGFNGLRIYFIRYDATLDKLSNANRHIKLVPGKEVSQVSLAIVPVSGFDPVTLAGDDCTEGDMIWTLSFCDPRVTAGAGAAGTGHCPPVCVEPRRTTS